MLRRSLIFLVLLSAGCVSLDPHYSTPESPIPATLPGAQGQGKAISHDWQQVIHDPRLQQVVTIALATGEPRSPIAAGSNHCTEQ